MKSGFSSVSAGTTYSIANVPAGAAIGVSPGATGSMLVQYRISIGGPLRNWTVGTVSTDSAASLPYPCAEVKFTATTADGVAEWAW